MAKPTNNSQTKTIWPPGTMLFPLPAVLVSCGTLIPYDCNLITVAWTGIISTKPPRCYISVRPERHSYQTIKSSQEFVINLTTRELVTATDWCGVKSKTQGFDKFRALNLTPIESQSILAPLLAESPLNLECKVYQILESGSHHLFLADILHVHADNRLIDPQSGRFNLDSAQLICYSHGQYYGLGEALGHFGFSVKKRKD